jgi:hypothetical protein
MIRELHSLSAESIDVWCADFFLAVAAKVAVAKIVCHNQNDVGGSMGISNRRLPVRLLIGEGP